MYNFVEQLHKNGAFYAVQKNKTKKQVNNYLITEKKGKQIQLITGQTKILSMMAYSLSALQETSELV